MTPSDWAWLTLAGVAGWDTMCPQGHTLSEGVGRYHAARPWLTRIVVAYLVAHLLDWLPPRFDALHQLTKGLRSCDSLPRSNDSGYTACPWQR